MSGRVPRWNPACSIAFRVPNYLTVLELALCLVAAIAATSTHLNCDDTAMVSEVRRLAASVIQRRLRQDLAALGEVVLQPDVVGRVVRRLCFLPTLLWNAADLGAFAFTAMILIALLLGDKMRRMVRERLPMLT